MFCMHSTPLGSMNQQDANNPSLAFSRRDLFLAAEVFFDPIGNEGLLVRDGLGLFHARFF